MRLRKPSSVENDPYKSAKWDELTAGRSFAQSDAPTLALLCQWHKVADTAMDELDHFGGETAYTNDMGDLKAFPQIATLKTASGEIRQLNKQLGIIDTAEAEDGNGGDNILSMRCMRCTMRSTREPSCKRAAWRPSGGELPTFCTQRPMS